MNLQDYQKFDKAAMVGDIKDDLNPIFAFSTETNEVLAYLLRDDVDLKKMVHRQLAGRGCDVQGKWIGHLEARQAFYEVYGENPY